jgi:hypothetical protein
VETFLPLGAGLGAFVVGRQAMWLRRPAYLALIGIAVTVVVLAWPVNLLCDMFLGPWLFRIGGVPALAMAAGLFLLGVVCMLPNRTMRPSFVATAVALVGVFLFLQGGGRLIWRVAFAGMWSHTANTEGLLQQSTGITCAPACAVMLLHHHGVTVSEGEMAYHSATSITGTNLHALADAMAHQLDRPACVEWTSYDTLHARGDDFIAAVKLPWLRVPHAIYVEALTEEHAIVVDPLEGRRKHVRREEFEQWWVKREVVRMD